LPVIKIAAQIVEQKIAVIDSKGAVIDQLDAPQLLFQESETGKEHWHTHIPLELIYTDGTKYILEKYRSSNKTAYYKKEGLI